MRRIGLGVMVGLGFLATTAQAGLNLGIVNSVKHQAQVLKDQVVEKNTPRITSLTALPDRVAEGNSTTVTCQAVSPDGSLLTYSWTASSGTLLPHGAQAVWTAPGSPAVGQITCQAIDPQGRKVSATVLINNNAGKLKQAYATGGLVGGPAAIGANGVIYIGNIQGHMLALRDTGTSLAPNWVYPGNHSFYAAPVIDEHGTLFAATGSGGLVGFEDLGNTSTASSLSLGFFGTNYNNSPALCGNGDLYIGYYDPQLIAFQVQGNSLTAKWSFTTPTTDHIYNTPAIGGDGTLYIGSFNHSFYALADQGNTVTVKWAVDAQSAINAPAAIGTDGTIYFGTYTGTVYALQDQGNTVTVRWTFATGATTYGLGSAPVIASDGTVYFAGSDGKLYALQDHGTYATQKWTFTTGGAVYFSPAITSDNTIYVGSQDHHLYALRDEGNHPVLLWDLDTNEELVQTGATIGVDGTVYFGSNTGTFFAVYGSGHLADGPWPKYQQNLRNTGRR